MAPRRRQQQQQQQQRRTESSASDRILARTYYNTKSSAGFASVRKLVNASGLPRKTVLKWLQAQPTYTLHAPARKQGYPTRRYIVHTVDEQWQADLADMVALSKYNKGYRYILTVIDLFSRYAWARPLRSKQGAAVAAAFKDIFRRDRRIPKRVQTDQGREFENSHVRSLFRRRNIELFSIKSAYKAAVVERFNRTLKDRLWRYFTANITLTWARNGALSDAVYAYNRSVHRTLKRRPIDIASGAVSVDTARDDQANNNNNNRSGSGKRYYDIHVGDTVRLSKVKGVFARGYLPQWTEEYFRVASIDQRHIPTTYQLRDSAGELVEGSFYRQEIQPIVVREDEDEFMVERVVRRQRRNGVGWALVKWAGHPNTMNSWVRQSDLRNVTHRQPRSSSTTNLR